jgi:NTE family protein
MAKKLGVCLTGGGGRGAYQIGALKALHDLGILQKVDAFSGTSIGSANAAVIATRPISRAVDVWFSLPEDNFQRMSHQSDSPGEMRRRLLEIDRGIYSMDKFEDTIMHSVDFNAIKHKEVYATISKGGKKGEGFFELIRSSFRHYVQKESNVVYMPLWKLTEKQVIKSIVASCSVPIFFPPVSMDENKYYDGGVFDNIPIKPLVDSACEEIIIIHLHRHLFYNPNTVAPNVKFHEIKHRGYLGSVLNFSQNHILELYELGYKETMDYYKPLESEGSL